jgi:DNA-binding HxlR family transcriptional regulator
MSPRSGKTRKSYNQVCSVAKALDVVGDRWTMLIVRELLGGAARFHELEAGLPGVAKNLLTDRLRQLEADEVIRRTTSGTSTLYALTDLGEALRPVVEGLGYWGAKVRRVGPAEHSRSIRSKAMAMQTFLSRADGALLTDPYVAELDVDGEPLEIILGPRPTVTARPSTSPAVRLRVPASAIDSYLGGKLDKKQFAFVSGDRAARTALLAALGSMFSASK